MAAVLCGGIGQCLKGCCDCLGSICMLPIKICGTCCEGCGQCCQDTCTVVTNCCSSSFCFYITVTLALNIPPIILGLSDLPNLGNGCQASYWLIIFWLLCMIHIIAAFYMSRAVDQDSENSILPTQDQQGYSNFSASNGASRMKHLFCYDGWMAIYMVIVMGYFVWLLVGGALFAIDGGDECDKTMSTVMIAYGFGWAFCLCGGCALCCSLCCGIACNYGRPAANNPNTHFVNTNQQSQPAQQPAQQAAQPQYSATTGTKTGAPAAASTTSSTTGVKPTASTIGTPTTPVTPVSPSAPVAEVPVASATPIDDDNNAYPSKM